MYDLKPIQILGYGLGSIAFATDIIANWIPSYEIWPINLSFVAACVLFLLTSKYRIFSTEDENKVVLFMCIIVMVVTFKYPFFVSTGLIRSNSFIQFLRNVDSIIFGTIIIVAIYYYHFKEYKVGKEKSIWKNKDIEFEVYNSIISIVWFSFGLVSIVIGFFRLI